MNMPPRRVPSVSVPARSLRATRLNRPQRSDQQRLHRLFSWSGWGRGAKAIATLATLVTGLAAIGALYVTNRTLDATRQQVAISEQGQYTDRFGKAVEQLGSDKIDIRLGGIYSLERLAKDSPRDATTITQLLATYIREHTCPTGGTITTGGPRSRPPTDVAAAFAVLAARDLNQTATWADVTGACLEHRDFGAGALENIDLGRAKLADTSFTRTVLRGVRMHEADLSAADLQGSVFLDVQANFAQFPRANLQRVALRNSSFTGANLAEARLDNMWCDDGRPDDGTPNANATQPAPTLSSGPHFTSANLTHASFTASRIPHASFLFATLEGADFSRSDLRLADFRVLRTQPPAEQVRFDNADLSGATFAGRDMRRMSLVGTNLSNSDLQDVDLRDVYLSRTNLTGANLNGAKR
ncbi:pentapeptide repeat-containing protein [Amycolatopsis azurea]|uniref:pentapeptide repeat-containing protein n=1 Tax=Amycolatopsis azurea TaxID=36819 RepID=UPI003810AEE9